MDLKGDSRYIVKRRTVEIHARGTISQVRAVRKFSKWVGCFYEQTLAAAKARVEQERSRGGLYEWAIFHGGKRYGD